MSNFRYLRAVVMWADQASQASAVRRHPLSTNSQSVSHSYIPAGSRLAAVSDSTPVLCLQVTLRIWNLKMSILYSLVTIVSLTKIRQTGGGRTNLMPDCGAAAAIPRPTSQCEDHPTIAQSPPHSATDCRTKSCRKAALTFPVQQLASIGLT